MAIEALLRRYGKNPHANQVGDLVEKVTTDADAVVRFLAGDAWWGSSGSMVDTNLAAELPREGPSPDEDNRQFCTLMLEVIQNLSDRGQSNPTFHAVVALLRAVLARPIGSRM